MLQEEEGYFEILYLYVQISGQIDLDVVICGQRII